MSSGGKAQALSRLAAASFLLAVTASTLSLPQEVGAESAVTTLTSSSTYGFGEEVVEGCAREITACGYDSTCLECSVSAPGNAVAWEACFPPMNTTSSVQDTCATYGTCNVQTAVHVCSVCCVCVQVILTFTTLCDLCPVCAQYLVLVSAWNVIYRIGVVHRLRHVGMQHQVCWVS